MRVNAQEIASGQNNVNLTVDSIWDDTDLTYVMTGTIQLGSAFSIAHFPSTQRQLHHGSSSPPSS